MVDNVSSRKKNTAYKTTKTKLKMHLNVTSPGHVLPTDVCKDMYTHALYFLIIEDCQYFIKNKKINCKSEEGGNHKSFLPSQKKTLIMKLKCIFYKK